jgi:hypothetical protein
VLLAARRGELTGAMERAAARGMHRQQLVHAGDLQRAVDVAAVAGGQHDRGLLPLRQLEHSCSGAPMFRRIEQYPGEVDDQNGAVRASATAFRRRCFVKRVTLEPRCERRTATRNLSKATSASGRIRARPR